LQCKQFPLTQAVTFSFFGLQAITFEAGVAADLNIRDRKTGSIFP
jgi:hypothetical protein